MDMIVLAGDRLWFGLGAREINAAYMLLDTACPVLVEDALGRSFM